MNTVRRPRRLALAVASLGLALAATGCSYMNPVQTHDFYQAADGTNASLERDGREFAGVRNAILVEESEGSSVLYATAVNTTKEPLQVKLEGSGEGGVLFSTSVTVPAQGTVKIGPDEAQTVSVSEDIATGDVLTLTVTSDGISEEISLPTTGVSLEHYQRSDGGGDA